jgi:hypothetical protein
VKLISTDNQVDMAGTIASGVTLSEYSMPDFGDLTAYAVRGVIAMTPTAINSVAAGVTEFSWGVVGKYQTPSTTFLTNERMIVCRSYQTDAAGAGELVQIETQIELPIYTSEVHVRLFTVCKLTNVDCVILKTRLIYDVYQLTQTEYLEALGASA